MSYLRYAVRLDAPSRHLAEIELRFPVDAATVDITLPAWCPGSYLIRDYARFVRDLVVFGEDGAPRRAVKRDKSTWSIEPGSARELCVRYTLYGHDLTVRTNHIDAGHAFLHGPATFVFPPHLRAAPVELELAVPDGWTLTTAMAWNPSRIDRFRSAAQQGSESPYGEGSPCEDPSRIDRFRSAAQQGSESPYGEGSPCEDPSRRDRPRSAERQGSDVPSGGGAPWDEPAAPGTPHRLVAANIDELYDHPIHLGPVRTFAVPAKVPVKLAIWGERAPGGVFDERRLTTDLGAIVDDHIARFGTAPFAHYTFLLMLAHDSYGGLEHRASSVNLYHPYFAASRKHYEALLELLSHELFHVWNGKRIAPRPLVDPDYTREAYTPCLWLMEGLTSHYDRYALRSSNRITTRSFLEKVLDDWARLLATPGRRRQSLEASSFDAWIKLYKPDESNLNTTVSYYLKGGLAMCALDLQIRRRTEGARTLDDVLRVLWKRYGAIGEPHPDHLQPVFEEASGLSLAEVFERQIRGVEDPELPEELRHVGLELRTSTDPAQVADGAGAVWLGATLGNNKVTGVFDDSPACVAGLSPGDEIIAIDGFRVTTEAELRSIAGAQRPGDQVELALFRRGRLLRLPLRLGAAPATRYEIVGIAEPGPAAARYHAWLGEPHPGAQTLATITTTARWV